MAEMRSRSPDENQLMFVAFDLLHQNGVDVRQLPLAGRKHDLHRLCGKAAHLPFQRDVQTFPDGAVLLEHYNYFGFEGIGSKRLAARYMSGPSRSWVKVKCPDWKAANEHRGKLFEGSKKRRSACNR
jgi:bifunctional non-homologous end joining protein LigD